MCVYIYSIIYIVYTDIVYIYLSMLKFRQFKLKTLIAKNDIFNDGG